MVAISMIAAVIVGLLGMLPLAFHSIERSADDVQANALGQQYADSLRDAIVAGAPLPGSQTFPISGGNSFQDSTLASNAGSNFTFTNNGCPVIVGSTVRDCVVTINWTERGAPNQALLESYVTPPQ